MDDLPEVIDRRVGVKYSYVLIRDHDDREWLDIALTLIEDIIGSSYELPKISSIGVCFIMFYLKALLSKA